MMMHHGDDDDDDDDDDDGYDDDDDDDDADEEETTMKGARPCREYHARQKRDTWKSPVATSANSAKPGSTSAIEQKPTKASRNLQTRTSELLTTSLACVSFPNPQSDRATRQTASKTSRTSRKRQAIKCETQ